MNPTLDQSVHIKSNIWLLHLTVLVLTRDVPLSQWSIFWNKFYLYKIYASAKRPLVTNPFSSSSNRYCKSDIIYVRLMIQENIFMSSLVNGTISNVLKRKMTWVESKKWPKLAWMLLWGNFLPEVDLISQGNYPMDFINIIF